VLADSTDDALNEFYVENMATHLTSEVAATASENPPSNSKGAKEEKAQKGGKTHQGSEVRVHANQPANPFFSYRSSAAVTNAVHFNSISAIDAKYPKVKALVGPMDTKYCLTVHPETRNRSQKTSANRLRFPENLEHRRRFETGTNRTREDARRHSSHSQGNLPASLIYDHASSPVLFLGRLPFRGLQQPTNRLEQGGE
jgi:hypothetical protein